MKWIRILCIIYSIQVLDLSYDHLSFPPCACNTSLSIGIAIHDPVLRKHKLTSQKLLPVSFVFLRCFRFTDTSSASFLRLCLPCVFLPLCLAWGHWTRGLHVLPWTSPSQRWEIGQNLVIAVRGCWKTHDLQLDTLLFQACYLWITGSPPSRLQKTGRENIHDFMSKFQKFHSEDDDEDLWTWRTAKVWGNNCWKGRVKDQETFITGSV